MKKLNLILASLVFAVAIASAFATSQDGSLLTTKWGYNSVASDCEQGDLIESAAFECDLIEADNDGFCQVDLESIGVVNAFDQDGTTCLSPIYKHNN